MTFGDTVLAAIVGGISASIVAPLVFYFIEMHRTKQSTRLKRIEAWRAAIDGFDFENFDFGDTAIYAAMRPFMDNDAIQKFEADGVMYVSGGRGDDVLKQCALDQVSKIEKNWNLI